MWRETGGWTRQVTARELGISKDIAGVNMRLNAGGERDLHWHKAAEIDAQGRNFVDDVGVGDLPYFASGIPMRSRASIRRDANFCSCSTMATSTTSEVLGKNSSERYIFPAPVPGPLSSDKIKGTTAVPQGRAAPSLIRAYFRFP
jgi:oxalate decarboxylase